MNPPPPDTIVCVECGGRCRLITFLPEDEPVEPGAVLSYRCGDCQQRWDIVWEGEE
ncbi:MAG TPA: hypothetical protein VE173_13545 [Longimicrobiales bacterium]|nr:hypothetical protein [Longimicrobiales bacterium]